MEKENVLDPQYWRDRLAFSGTGNDIHKSVFLAGADRWQRIQDGFRTRLAESIHPGDRVLDAGCAYGHLIDLLPNCVVSYTGIDISGEFIDEAIRRMQRRPIAITRTYTIQQMDIRNMPRHWGDEHGQSFDVAVLGSVKGMVIRHEGHEVWEEMERELLRVAKRLLILEYGDHL